MRQHREVIQGAGETLTAVFQQTRDGYIAFVEELPGANTQGATLDEARRNLREAIELVLDLAKRGQRTRRT